VFVFSLFLLLNIAKASVFTGGDSAAFAHTLDTSDATFSSQPWELTDTHPSAAHLSPSHLALHIPQSEFQSITRDYQAPSSPQSIPLESVYEHILTLITIQMPSEYITFGPSAKPHPLRALSKPQTHEKKAKLLGKKQPSLVKLLTAITALHYMQTAQPQSMLGWELFVEKFYDLIQATVFLVNQVKTTTGLKIGALWSHDAHFEGLITTLANGNATITIPLFPNTYAKPGIVEALINDIILDMTRYLLGEHVCKSVVDSDIPSPVLPAIAKYLLHWTNDGSKGVRHPFNQAIEPQNIKPLKVALAFHNVILHPYLMFFPGTSTSNPGFLSHIASLLLPQDKHNIHCILDTLLISMPEIPIKPADVMHQEALQDWLIEPSNPNFLSAKDFHFMSKSIMVYVLSLCYTRFKGWVEKQPSRFLPGKLPLHMSVACLLCDGPVFSIASYNSSLALVFLPSRASIDATKSLKPLLFLLSCMRNMPGEIGKALANPKSLYSQNILRDNNILKY